MDNTYFGVPEPGKRGRGAAGKVKVVVAVETPGNKPRFASMYLVPRVSDQEIQALERERLVKEVVVKTDGRRGCSFLDALPYRHEWLVPVPGKEGSKVFALGSHLDHQYQRRYPRCPSRRQPKASAPLPGEILLPLQPAFLGTAHVQPDASCLLEYLEPYILGAMAIAV